MKSRHLCAALITVAALTMTGCGGGGSGGTSGTVSGVAASGSVLTGTVYLKDSSNPARELSKTINADGSYSFDVSGLTAPFMLKAVPTAGSTLFSFAGGPGTANINPISSIVVQAALGSDPSTAYNAPSAAAFQGIASNLAAALQQIQVTLRPLLLVYNAAGVNPISDSYAANHQGLDGMLDATHISIASGTVTITNSTITKAIVKLSTAGLSSGQLIAAIQVSLQLPAGVTPATLSGSDATGSLTLSGVAMGLANTIPMASFSSSTGLLNIGQLSVPSSGGMPMGEFLTITCNVAQGADLSSFPTQATSVTASSLSGSLSGITSPLSVTFQ